MKNKYLPSISAALIVISFASPSHAQPGSGIRVGETTLLTPEISASYNWNSNVNVRRRALDEGGDRLDQDDSDSFIKGQVSLALSHWNKSSRINARTWYNIENYSEFTDLDEPSYGANLGWFWARPGAETTIRTDLSYQIAIDKTESTDGQAGDSLITSELENIAERVERTEYRAGITIDQKLMRDTRGDLSYSYANLLYNDERFNDRQSHILNAEINNQFSVKTQPYLRVGIGIDDDEGLDGNAEEPFFLVGVRRTLTDKLNMDLALGYETYTRTPLEGVSAGQELEDSSLKWTANVNYAATHKTRISLNGRNGYGSVASPGSSSREEVSLSLAMDHQTTRQLNQRLSVAWRQDDYLTPIPARGGLVDELKETLFYQYNIDYQTVRPWLSLFASLSYEDGSSKIPGDSYTETELSIGAKARY